MLNPRACFGVVIFRGSAVWLRTGRTANRDNAQRDKGRVCTFIGAGNSLGVVCLLYQGQLVSRNVMVATRRIFCDEGTVGLCRWKGESGRLVAALWLFAGAIPPNWRTIMTKRVAVVLALA